MRGNNDHRGKIKLDISLLKNWLDTHYNVYARDYVTINGLQQPLVISVSMRSNFIVSLGSDILYDDNDLVEAMNIFNLKAGGIKELWTNIEPEKRNKVNHTKPLDDKTNSTKTNL
jgi:hypothetical protein